MDKQRRGRSRRVIQEETPSSGMFKIWAGQVFEILDKPHVAVVIFMIGVFIIVIASKQLRLTFDVIDYYSAGSRPEEGFIGNFMVVFVFIFVWIDVVILQWLKEVMVYIFSFLSRRYHHIIEALEKVKEDDEFNELKQRRMLRRRKTSE